MKIADSQRLSFTPMTADDAQLLFELDQDVEVMRYVSGGITATMKDIIERWIPRMQSYTDKEKGWGIHKVIVTATQQFIGWVLVRPMDFFGDNPELENLELGWRFKQAAWGKGYATEAAAAIKTALAAIGKVKQFSAIAIPDNKASINIMKKLGMSYVKTDMHKDPLGDIEVAFYTQVVG
ncbi:MAG: RimJ/RimL family protein N-acetyltransferase [Alteromonadaceae bacterium]|jgi:RimJ/RimL family protein N-acetyltransferase